MKTTTETEQALRNAIPGLIMQHNLHGIDIDPRARQIAALSLWLRAQRSYQKLGLKAVGTSPNQRRSTLSVLSRCPAKKTCWKSSSRQELSHTPAQEAIAHFVRQVFTKMKLAGEPEMARRTRQPEQGRLFADDTAPPAQKERGLDVTGITDETFWEKAEERIYAALQTYAEQAEHGGGYQRRLFADDAARGFAFIDLCRKRYDVALMNPPFGSATHEHSRAWFRANYPTAGENLSVGTIQQSLKRLAPGGFVGLIGDLPWLQQAEYAKFREELLAGRHLKLFGELGWGILGTDVEVAVAIFTPPKNPNDCVCEPRWY